MKWLKVVGIFISVVSVVSIVSWIAKLDLPTLSWFYETNEVFGYLFFTLALMFGILVSTGVVKPKVTPMALRKWERFRSIKRGWYAFILIGLMMFLATMDQLIVGDRALIVKYEGKLYFPALMQKQYKKKDFGTEGAEAESKVNYRILGKIFKREDKGNFVLMPLVPYGPTNDTVTGVSSPLEKGNDGLFYHPDSGELYSGQAATLYDTDSIEFIHLRYKFRNGKKVGEVIGRDKKKRRVYAATIVDGVESDTQYTGEGSVEDFHNAEASDLRIVYYKPSPPSFRDRHFLGTDSQGNDILAYLFGGLQVIAKATILYIPIVYIIGVSIGMIMGYFGGWTDIIVQRLIEIFSVIPFLYVILILSSMIDEEFRGLGLILVILIMFGWMGMTNLMRTATYKEKSREYVQAARSMGASHIRIMFKHIIPNTVAILVTLIPFSVSGVVLALTSLDYLGFGLPADYATWGRLLKDGLENISSPWVVSSAFFMLVLLLVLVTFVGEAVREAFDPKKFTFYK